MTELETIAALLKVIPNIGGYVAAVILLVGLYTRRVCWGYQLEDLDKRFAGEREKLEARRVEDVGALKQLLQEKSDECREYTSLAREALFNSRKSIDIVQKIKEGT